MSTQEAQRRAELVAGQPITEVLVPVETGRFHERGLSIAARFALHWQLPVRLVHVRGTDSEIDLGLSDTTDRFTARYPDLEVAASDIISDSVADGIAGTVRPGSLVVLASEHASQWSGLASVAEDVMRLVDTAVVDRFGGSGKGAVLVCGPGCQEPVVDGPIVLALDGSPRSEGAIETAVAMARNNEQTLRLVSVIDPSTVEHLSRLRARGQEVSENAYLRSVAEQLTADEGLDVAWEVIHESDPVAAIAAFANGRRAAMVVAATHGQTGLARRVFGSICMGLAERGPTPVLVVNTSRHDVELPS